MMANHSTAICYSMVIVTEMNVSVLLGWMTFIFLEFSLEISAGSVTELRKT
jgi:hypothetical protein